jgi:hypothetical protein
VLAVELPQNRETLEAEPLEQVSTVIGQVSAIFTTANAGEALSAVDSATLEPGRGLAGDRYARRTGTFSEKLESSGDWEVTLIEAEEIDRYNESQGTDLSPGAFRRNIVTRGVRLNDLVGRRFFVGESLLEGIRLCEPCAYLASLLGPGVVKAMVHRAGLRARILEGATVRRGDTISDDASN